MHKQLSILRFPCAFKELVSVEFARNRAVEYAKPLEGTQPYLLNSFFISAQNPCGVALVLVFERVAKLFMQHYNAFGSEPLAVGRVGDYYAVAHGGRGYFFGKRFFGKRDIFIESGAFYVFCGYLQHICGNITPYEFVGGFALQFSGFLAKPLPEFVGKIRPLHKSKRGA